MSAKTILTILKPVAEKAGLVTKQVKTVENIGLMSGQTEAVVGDIVQFSRTAGGEIGSVAHTEAELAFKSKKLDRVSKKLFTTFEEFRENALGRIGKYKGCVPDKLYNAVEANAKSNKFELTKVIDEYYAGLKECKTMEEVVAMYPEFAHLNFDVASGLRTMIESTLTKEVCLEAKQFATKEEQINYLMTYFKNFTGSTVEKWSSYQEILKVQREVAADIANGTSVENIKNATECTIDSIKHFFNGREPLSHYSLDKTTRDNILLSYLRQYYVEGKRLHEMTPVEINGRTLLPSSINGKHFHFADKEYMNFRKTAASIDNEVTEYKAITQLTKTEIDSATMIQAWTKSRLRMDMANETQYKKGWYNIKNILLKKKGVQNDISSSEEIIDRYLLERFKMDRRKTESNPFAKFDSDEIEPKRIQVFINGCYRMRSSESTDVLVLRSEEFKEFKAKFNLEEMRTSLENVEGRYLKLFFKRFWTEDRKLRFGEALKQSHKSAAQSIEVSDEILIKAMQEIVA